MAINNNIRAIAFRDLPDLKTVIEANDLFPPDMLDEMISGYFNNENQSEFWFTYENDQPIAIGYCAPEKMTEGT